MPKAAIEVDSTLQNNETVQLRLIVVCPAHTCRAGYTEVTLKLAISRHFHAIHGGQTPSVLRIQGAEMSNSQIGLRTHWCVITWLHGGAEVTRWPSAILACRRIKVLPILTGHLHF